MLKRFLKPDQSKDSEREVSLHRPKEYISLRKVMDKQKVKAQIQLLSKKTTLQDDYIFHYQVKPPTDEELTSSFQMESARLLDTARLGSAVRVTDH